MTPADNSPLPRSLAMQLGAAAISRLCLNTARRFLYPFAPALGRGLGVPLTSMTSLIAASQAATMLSPIFGPIGDRHGYRIVMLAGLGLLAAGMFTAGFVPLYPVVVLSIMVAMIGKSMFDPALHAYVGELVPFKRRGLAIGVIELSWAGSALIGIPLAGLAMEFMGWRAPFFALGGLALFSAAAMRIAIGDGGRKVHGTAPLFNEAWKRLGANRAALGALCFGFLISAANDNLFVIYGVWLEEAYSLNIIALGMSTTAIGLAELMGEGLAATISDRFGLKRSVFAGLLLSMGGYAALPLFARTLPLALAGLFVTFLAFEFTVIIILTICTELLPGARGTMMSANMAAMSFGRVFGAFIGGPVWLAGGIRATAIVSVTISTSALVILFWGLRGWRGSHDE